MSNVGSLLVMPVHILLQENIPLIPAMHKKGDGWALSVDGAIIFSGMKSFGTAMQTWFASFYILSIEFPVEVRETCNFIEKVLMGEGKGKVSSVLRKWANRLLL
jgi:hypothetical protein